MSVFPKSKTLITVKFTLYQCNAICSQNPYSLITCLHNFSIGFETHTRFFYEVQTQIFIIKLCAKVYLQTHSISNSIHSITNSNLTHAPFKIGFLKSQMRLLNFNNMLVNQRFYTFISIYPFHKLFGLRVTTYICALYQAQI